ncbi:MAG TPA: hypothetical protein PKV16_05225 [Caldisericia bacterium]|nr:hypothetical protein [Caldisericia bacterium]HPF48715.1 hypothetical protein [Caldisericia bacterium]HPI83625.1 hypothetical protein [Caldisericia bacterium]HPQ93170.1 hypothetical protein [Caldisericia bacterium]HRV74997.1 hypothetical protein [Caldisericia bacterium]
MQTIKCGETIEKTTVIKCINCNSPKGTKAGEKVSPCPVCNGCTFYY